MRNESTNDRLLALEKQTLKILSASKSCGQTGSNNDKTSENLITDSVTLARKTTKSLEKKPYFLRGENHSTEMDLDCSRTVIYVSFFATVFAYCEIIKFFQVWYQLALGNVFTNLLPNVNVETC